MSLAVAETLANNAPPAGAVAEAANNNAAAEADAALEAIWNKNERDHGSEREGGKFASPNPEKKAEAGKESPAGGGGEEQAGGGLTPDAGSVPLPANW